MVKGESVWMAQKSASLGNAGAQPHFPISRSLLPSLLRACVAQATHTSSVKMNDANIEEALIDNESVPHGLDDARYRSSRAGRPKNGYLRPLGGPGRKPRACECSIAVSCSDDSISNKSSRSCMSTSQNEMRNPSRAASV